MPTATHIDALKSNMAEINRLLAIHKQVAGAGAGRKLDVEVLNKSGIVLLLACWEAYIEDLAAAAFKRLLTVATEPTAFPEHVLAIAAKEIKKSDTLTFWGIAKDGWKAELTKHGQRVLDLYIERGSFNTPSAPKIDRLFSEMVGLTSVSKQWYWGGMSHIRSAEKLAQLIELRGNIAHRVKTSHPVMKADVVQYKQFIYRLAVITHNRTNVFLQTRFATKHWPKYVFKSTR